MKDPHHKISWGTMDALVTRKHKGLDQQNYNSVGAKKVVYVIII